jgi:hypothetical protein
MLSIFLVAIALAPISVAMAPPTDRSTEREESIVTRSLIWLAALGVAGSYHCAIAGLKVWSMLRPPRSAD